MKNYTMNKQAQRKVDFENRVHLDPRSSLFKLLSTILFFTVLSKVFMSESSMIFSFLYQYTDGSGSPGLIELYGGVFPIIIRYLHTWKWKLLEAEDHVWCKIYLKGDIAVQFKTNFNQSAKSEY